MLVVVRCLIHFSQWVARHTPRDILRSGASHHERAVGTGARAGIDLRGASQDRIIDILDDLLHGFVFIVVAVDVDNQRLVEPALIALTCCIDQELRRVELRDRHLV